MIFGLFDEALELGLAGGVIRATVGDYKAHVAEEVGHSLIDHVIFFLPRVLSFKQGKHTRYCVALLRIQE